AGVAEVSVVEDLRRIAVAELTVEPHDLGDLVAPVLRLADLAALVAEAAAHGDVEGAGVEKLDLTLTTFLLAVGNNPDVGANASVVEHLLRQGDDGFEPVVLNDPLADVALAGAGATGEEWRATEDNSQTRAVLVLVGQHGLELADHVLQEEQ